MLLVARFVVESVIDRISELIGYLTRLIEDVVLIDEEFDCPRELVTPLIQSAKEETRVQTPNSP